MCVGKLLDAEEAAETLRVHRQTLSRYVARGNCSPLTERARAGNTSLQKKSCCGFCKKRDCQKRIGGSRNG